MRPSSSARIACTCFSGGWILQILSRRTASELLSRSASKLIFLFTCHLAELSRDFRSRAEQLRTSEGANAECPIYPQASKQIPLSRRCSFDPPLQSRGCLLKGSDGHPARSKSAGALWSAPWSGSRNSHPEHTVL